MVKEIVVISGINLIDGGPLSVYIDLLDSIVENNYYDKYRIIAFVGKKELFSKYIGKIEIVELPKSKSSWLYRLYYEFYYFKKFSKSLNVELWLSMHDITPNVVAKRRYVYCHNASPFIKIKITEAKYDFKFYLFSKYYKYLYAINIKKNDGVIVQHNWMRKEFKELFKVNNIIVARPSVPKLSTIIDTSKQGENIFIFPSVPRYNKNFQVACKASCNLVSEGINNFRLIITLDGTENKYAQELVELYNKCENIIFTGLFSREELYKKYSESNCLVFMSKLESWGMPITEYQSTGKRMIVSDLPYAHETVGNYDCVEFVDPNDDKKLTEIMKRVIQSKDSFGKANIEQCDQPYCKDWKDLLVYLFK